jgi:hypothetical protein
MFAESVKILEEDNNHFLVLDTTSSLGAARDEEKEE